MKVAFRKITTKGIIAKLKKLVSQEKIKCEEEALYALAKSADGSMRDAEVILDQMNSFSKGKITCQKEKPQSNCPGCYPVQCLCRYTVRKFCKSPRM